MDARTALIAAIVCGLAAVAAVTADVAWTLELHLQTSDDQGEWSTVAMDPYDHGYRGINEPWPYGCSGSDLRVLIDNDRPIGASGDLRVVYSNFTGEHVLVRERVSLGAFEDKAFTFDVPDDAFRSPDPEDTRDVPPTAMVSVLATFDDLFVSTSACKGVSQ